jgi:hypothetical protein
MIFQWMIQLSLNGLRLWCKNIWIFCVYKIFLSSEYTFSKQRAVKVHPGWASVKSDPHIHHWVTKTKCVVQILILLNFHELLAIKCHFQQPSSSDSPLQFLCTAQITVTVFHCVQISHWKNLQCKQVGKNILTTIGNRLFFAKKKTTQHHAMKTHQIAIHDAWAEAIYRQ